MKFMHLADLHIGKNLYGYSIDEDEKYILDEAIRIAREKDVDTVLICGDVYDKSIPSAQATSRLNSFLSRLHEENLKVCMISGNHDSRDRLNYGSEIFDGMDIHIASEFKGEPEKVEFADEFGKYTVHMLPFVSLRDFPDRNKDQDLADCFDNMIESCEKGNGRNLFMGHQFVLNSAIAGSEDHVVGNAEAVRGAKLQDFDYAALGHIHKPQKIGSDHVRYAGTLLKFDSNEANQEKSIPVITMEEETSIELVPVKPLHEMVKLEGTLEELKDQVLDGKYKDDFVHIVWKGDVEPQGIRRELEPYLNKIMSIDFKQDDKRQTTLAEITQSRLKDPLKAIEEFYLEQNKNLETLDDERKDIIQSIWREVCGQ